MQRNANEVAAVDRVAPPTSTPRGATAGRQRRGRVVPDQHGAWAFLLLPAVLGVAADGWSPATPAVVAAWVVAYPFSWALTGTLAAPRPERFRRALVVWTLVAVPLGGFAVVLRPWLAIVGVAFAASFLLNLRFARQRRERALANDLVLVAECTAMVPVTAAVAATTGGLDVPVGAMTEAPVLVLALACAVTLVGSTLHVKSLIRERRNPRFGQVSRWYAVTSVAVIGAVVATTEAGAVLLLPFLVLAVRSFAVRDPRMRPARIGLVELACLVLVAGAAFAAV